MAFSLFGLHPITRLTIDLVGDDAPPVLELRGDDLRVVEQVRFTPVARGHQSMHLAVWDTCGATDRTGTIRPVEVR